MKYNRIYINSHLAENSKLELANDHIHYIKRVLRLKVNDGLRIFNGTDGEFLAQITDIGKNNLSVKLKEQLKKPDTESALTLAVAIIKQDKLMLTINMATQLGITKIIPLITKRCQFRSVNIKRLTKCMIEATEQSERLIPPIIEQAIKLQDYLKKNNNLMLYANEYEKEENSILQITSLLNNSDIDIVIGPEGGFTIDELQLLASYKNTKSISLGSNILRAETAAITAIAQVALTISFLRRWKSEKKYNNTSSIYAF
ncbi:16S rRNA (uracil(1498)-N(3))-methyltransferase [Rickettsia canadensis]|uniref:Ribosomal RNA small subunit methyltransferase E n=1 Tax=Rickettsia canadensis str. CA410 TaxID=1105107 RepID=A0ABM5MS56_RICCA|nr:16S rRNA (uracil(1498)-N(3))-methyltransferase [Rickettsia canadensis]AFB20771.1 16S ribosomal RNA methyltransferase RsmE [Rickettsia canadensis str. CA410]